MQDLTYDQHDGLASVRASSFLSKVLLFFGLAMAVSAAGTYAGFTYLSSLFVQHPGASFIFYAVELILVFTARWWSTKHPINYLLFATFAFFTGLTIVPLLAGLILAYGGPGIIIKALLATTLTFTAVATIGFVSQRSFSGLGGFLMMGLIGMIIVSLIGIFIPWSGTFELIFSGFGVLLFAGYTLYDISRLKHYPQDRYIDAALNLYLDIFNLFLFILRLMAGVSRRN